jgi:hypothetical protein
MRPEPAMYGGARSGDSGAYSRSGFSSARNSV